MAVPVPLWRPGHPAGAVARGRAGRRDGAARRPARPVALHHRRDAAPASHVARAAAGPAAGPADPGRPYQVVPFQFSLDVQKSPNGPCTHHDFLLEERRDPRRELVEAMLKLLLENAGSIVAFNMTFEIGVIKDLAETFPEYRAQMLSLVPRFRDLIVPFRSGDYVHRDFHGSNSLKDIQPVLVPSLSYKALDIQEGGTASLKYELFASGDMPEVEWKKTRENLLRYCGLDTGAMVEIMRVIASHRYSA